MNRTTSSDFKKKALSMPAVKMEYHSLTAAYALREKLVEKYASAMGYATEIKFTPKKT